MEHQHSSPISYLQSSWTVPPSPISNENQLIYLFPSITEGPRILQPVLTYGLNGLYHGGWTVAAWDVWGSTTDYAFKSLDIQVQPGDSILAIMSGIYPYSSDSGYSSYSITMIVNGSSYTQLPHVTVDVGQPFVTAQGGVMEVHASNSLSPTAGPSDCNGLPASGILQFSTSYSGHDGPGTYGFQFDPHFDGASLTPNCMYNPTWDPHTDNVQLSWWTGYQPYPLSFDTGTNWKSSPLGDWAYGQDKAECGLTDVMTGVSVDPSSSRPAHSALCKYKGGVLMSSTHVVDFSNTSVGDPGTWDWDWGYFKGECASNEAVVGIAQTPDGLTKILCAQINTGVYHAAGCNTRVFNPGGNMGDWSVGDWAIGYYKGQCASGEYVKGVSRFTGSGGKAHAIFCCTYG